VKITEIFDTQTSEYSSALKAKKLAKNFANVIEKKENLIVPTIVIYEVYKKIYKQSDQKTAEEYAANMKQGLIIELTPENALSAAKISHELKLPMADAIIYATAQEHNATIWTQDADFKNLESVKYFPRK
jgi:toxin FitB